MSTQEQKVEINQRIVECVISYIDRMNDICEQDTAERILNDFVPKITPLIHEYLDLHTVPIEHQRRQLWLNLDYEKTENLTTIDESLKTHRPGHNRFDRKE